ncbi:uncharacterized protein LOC126742984 [Anthonomus grandis grandis]|uniref:uncharacterized protein LOC126742984 n=1 Tax=Anthonomus grandis grandis TaxID=2921223 RepID=UPI0021665CBF|nr:uncharacterized protein LOC126742984 [Anthonomus grandis grandis]
MRNNPGKTMTIYNIPAIAKEALPLASTPSNIQAGFKVSGIYPFNRHIFSEDEFLPSAVSDRTLVIAHEVEENGEAQIYLPPLLVTLEKTAEKTPNNDELEVVQPQVIEQPGPSTSIQKHRFSPEDDARPTPQAAERTGTRKGRKRGKSAIWTDTPNKQELELIHEQKIQKEKKKKIKRNISKSETTTEFRPSRKSKAPCSSEEEEEETFGLICGESFNNSCPKEKWVQYTQCHYWAHEECTNKTPFFVCENCDSDDDM